MTSATAETKARQCLIRTMVNTAQPPWSSPPQPTLKLVLVPRVTFRITPLSTFPNPPAEAIGEKERHDPTQNGYSCMRDVG